jgi:hypothetical protein
MLFFWETSNFSKLFYASPNLSYLRESAGKRPARKKEAQFSEALHSIPIFQPMSTSMHYCKTCCPAAGKFTSAQAQGLQRQAQKGAPPVSTTKVVTAAQTPAAQQSGAIASATPAKA